MLFLKIKGFGVFYTCSVLWAEFLKLLIYCLNPKIYLFFKPYSSASLAWRMEFSWQILLFYSWAFTTQFCFYWCNYWILDYNTLIFLWSWAYLYVTCPTCWLTLHGEFSAPIGICLLTMTLFDGDCWIMVTLSGDLTFSLILTVCCTECGFGGKNPEYVFE